jgi:hypothetical protein
MRPNHVRAVAGALGFALPCAVVTPAIAQSESQGTPTMHISDRSLVVGHPARVSGGIDRAYAGRTAVLEFRAAGDSAWTALATTTVDRRGRYAMRRAVPRSGTLRVTIQHPAGSAAVAASQSAERSVAVSARVGVRSRRLNVRQGRRAVVAGVVEPAPAGLPVALQVRGRRGWRTIDRGRTAEGGAFRLRDRQRHAFSARIRVAVAGHDGLAPARKALGRLNVYRFAHASWYGPGLYGGHLACGGRLDAGTLGVAHKWLPCGTKVTLRHGRRSIRVRVVDRGPYVAGREYDLTSATAQRLGFHGHGALLVTR